MGLIITVSEADYSGNNIGKVDIPNPALERIIFNYIYKLETFGTVSDNIKDNLMKMGYSLYNSGVFDKLKSFYPIIGSASGPLGIDMMNPNISNNNLQLINGTIGTNSFISTTQNAGYIATNFIVNSGNYNNLSIGLKKSAGFNSGWLIGADTTTNYYGIGSSGSVGGVFGAVSETRRLLANFNNNIRHFALVSGNNVNMYPLDGGISESYTDTPVNPSKPIIIGGAANGGSYSLPVYGTYTTIWMADELNINEVEAMVNIIDQFDTDISR